MNERESDPTGAFHGGGGAGTEKEPHVREDRASSGVDETERDVVSSGTAATSEVADRDAQNQAEGQGDGTPLPR